MVVGIIQQKGKRWWSQVRGMVHSGAERWHSWQALISALGGRQKRWVRYSQVDKEGAEVVRLVSDGWTSHQRCAKWALGRQHWQPWVGWVEEGRNLGGYDNSQKSRPRSQEKCSVFPGWGRENMKTLLDVKSGMGTDNNQLLELFENPVDFHLLCIDHLSPRPPMHTGPFPAPCWQLVWWDQPWICKPSQGDMGLILNQTSYHLCGLRQAFDVYKLYRLF
jgi:hypothetical protein